MSRAYLVNRGRDRREGKDFLLEHALRGVGHADGTDLALLHHLLHLLPRVAERPVAHDVAVAIRECRNEVVVALRVQVDWPVDEVH